MSTDKAIARIGLSVNDRAAPGGPIIRLKISSAPTTGSVMLVASATTTRKYISIRRLRTPRTSASSGITDVSRSGRKRTMMAPTQSAPNPAIGAMSLALTPSTSPNSSDSISGPYSTLKLRNSAPRPSITTSARAVATSCRPRRPSQPMPSAPAREATASPMSVLIPMRLAPAAPAKAPCGTASATNAEPRSTTKNPTTPATTATMVATAHVFAMNPENMALSLARSGRRLDQNARRGGGPGSGVGPPQLPHGRRAGEDVKDEDQRHNEEADRPAVPGRRPVEAVIGEQDAQPGRRQADQGGPDHGQARPAGQPQPGRRRPDEQRGAQNRADGHGRQGHGDRDRHQAQQSDETHRDPPRHGQLSAYGAEQQRPVEHHHDAEAQHAQQRYDRDYRTVDGEYGPEQDRDRRARRVAVGGVPVEEQGRQAEARPPDDAGGQVPSPGPPGPDHVHDPRCHHADPHQAPQRGDSDEEGCRPAGDAEVRERMAGV